MTALFKHSPVLGHVLAPFSSSPSVLIWKRNAHTTFGPADLAFEKANATTSRSLAGTPPIVVLHGLFGQKQNWRSLSRAMARSMNTDVYALDLRNHGTSFHHADMTYTAMANDVRHFFDKHGLSNVALIGHSMGGKVASALALNPDLPSGTLHSLVIADVTPFRFPVSSEFHHYLEAMKAVQDANVPDAKSAQKVLAERNIPLDIQHFLLTNLGGPVKGVRKFRIPLGILSDSLAEVGGFPYQPGETRYDGPTLVIRGSKSNYVSIETLGKMRDFFPDLGAETLEAGHWVHAEKPTEFLDIVKSFIQRS